MSRLRRAREQKGLSRAILAAQSGMTVQGIHYLETTKGAAPETPNAVRLAQILGVQVAELWPVKEKDA